jgi:hypothetical protein
LALRTVLTGSARRRERLWVDSVVQPSLVVDAVSDEAQRSDRRGYVRLVPSYARKTERRCRQERGRRRVRERVWLVNVIQKRAVRLLENGEKALKKSKKKPPKQKMRHQKRRLRKISKLKTHLELPHAIQCLSHPLHEIILL